MAYGFGGGAYPRYGGFGRTGGTSSTSSTSGALSSALADMESANAANEMRYGQAMAIYDEIINRYQPGGSFEQRGLAEIEKGKTRDTGVAYGNILSSGLSGVTTSQQLGTAWESEVGAGKRLSLEDLMMTRLSGAQQNKAGFIERRTDSGPSYSDLMNIASQAGQAAGGGGGSMISGGSGLPTNYNPLNDPSRHSGSSGGGSTSGSSSSGTGSSSSPSYGGSGAGSTGGDSGLMNQADPGMGAGDAWADALGDAAATEQAAQKQEMPTDPGDGKQVWKEGDWVNIPYWFDTSDGKIHFADGRKPRTHTGGRTSGVEREWAATYKG